MPGITRPVFDFEEEQEGVSLEHCSPLEATEKEYSRYKRNHTGAPAVSLPQIVYIEGLNKKMPPMFNSGEERRAQYIDPKMMTAVLMK